jgi:hypothetical protein
MISAGRDVDGFGFCHGDAGSPLIIAKNNRPSSMSQIGIASPSVTIGSK